MIQSLRGPRYLSGDEAICFHFLSSEKFRERSLSPLVGEGWGEVFFTFNFPSNLIYPIELSGKTGRGRGESRGIYRRTTLQEGVLGAVPVL